MTVTRTEPGTVPATPRTNLDAGPRRTAVGDLMTRQVVALDPRTDYAVMIAALADGHHSMLPVVNAQYRVMGTVSSSDLLAKLAVRALPPRTAPFMGRRVRRLRRRAEAVVAREVMTTPAVTVTPATSAADAALLAVRKRIHRLPVVDPTSRVLVGMVCLCDLLRAMRRDDADIRSDILALALATDTSTDSSTLHVDCVRGRVQLDARTARRSQANTLLERVRAVEGVVDVAETLRWDIDDLFTPHQPYRL
jgi:CBS-domain-containing membrane protein